MTCEMLLHAEKESLFGLRLFRALFGRLHIAGGLGRRGEVAFLFVFLENHIYYSRGPTPARSHSATSRLARAAGAADFSARNQSAYSQHDRLRRRPDPVTFQSISIQHFN